MARQMNQSPTRTFGYQDALLVPAGQDAVARGLARYLAEAAAGPEAPAGGSALGRMVLRLTGRAARPRRIDGPEDPAPYRFRAIGEAAANLPMVRWTGPVHSPKAVNHAFEEGVDDIRLSTVAAAPDWTLVEFREPGSGPAPLGLALSSRLEGTDVLYLRRTVGTGGEPHWDFHVYRDAEPVRLVLCHATWPEADPQQARWERIAEGAPSAYEPGDLFREGDLHEGHLPEGDPGDEARGATLLDEAKLERILTGLGLSFRTLFGRDCRRDPHLFSRLLR